jgi:hypothetical protein
VQRQTAGARSFAARRDPSTSAPRERASHQARAGTTALGSFGPDIHPQLRSLMVLDVSARSGRIPSRPAIFRCVRYERLQVLDVAPDLGGMGNAIYGDCIRGLT